MNNLEQITNNHRSRMPQREEGGIGVGLLATAVAVPVCAYLTSYLGEGMGWVTGNIIDFIPFVQDVAPWLAERTGLAATMVDTANLNEDIYQTTGAVSGFYGGIRIGVELGIMAGKATE